MGARHKWINLLLTNGDVKAGTGAWALVMAEPIVWGGVVCVWSLVLLLRGLLGGGGVGGWRIGGGGAGRSRRSSNAQAREQSPVISSWVMMPFVADRGRGRLSRARGATARWKDTEEAEEEKGRVGGRVGGARSGWEGQLEFCPTPQRKRKGLWVLGSVWAAAGPQR